MLYHAYQAHADAAWPPRQWSRTIAPWLMQPPLGGHSPQRQFAAACELFNLVEVTHRRPDWGIHAVGDVPVLESTAHRTPFATLTRFARDVPQPGSWPGDAGALPKLLSNHGALPCSMPRTCSTF